MNAHQRRKARRAQRRATPCLQFCVTFRMPPLPRGWWWKQPAEGDA